MAPITPDAFRAEDHPEHDLTEGNDTTRGDWIEDPQPQVPVPAGP